MLRVSMPRILSLLYCFDAMPRVSMPRILSLLYCFDAMPRVSMPRVLMFRDARHRVSTNKASRLDVSRREASRLYDAEQINASRLDVSRREASRLYERMNPYSLFHAFRLKFLRAKNS